jgi:hypothetical protein
LTGPIGTMRPHPVFETKEGTMITLQDHIEELRAELRGCLSRREGAAVKAELTAAITAQKEHDGTVNPHHDSDGR